MNPIFYILIFLPLLVVIFQGRRNKKFIMLKFIKNKKKGRKQMEELVKRFIDKECFIYTFDGNAIECTVKSVDNGAVFVTHTGTEEIINLDFVIRVREYPRKKNGKKKSVVLD